MRNDTFIRVYFDDFKVSHTKSPIVQTNDYYPFGLTFNSYSRENSTTQRFKFQGQENIDDLKLNWDAFQWRNYSSEIGRFFNVDPLADKFPEWSSYSAFFCNPLRFVDPTGMAPKDNLGDNDDWFENAETGQIEWRNSQEVAIKDDKGTWNNIGEELLTFDSKNLTYYTQKKLEDGNLKLNSKSFEAVSGKQLDDGSFNYSKEAQATPFAGPLPAGDYSINPSGIQWWADQSFITRTEAFVKLGAWPGGLFAWGVARTWISPLEVSVTNPTTGQSVLRNKFSIHGGASPGSAGCIDLTTKDLPFFRMLEKSQAPSIKLRVTY